MRLGLVALYVKDQIDRCLQVFFSRVDLESELMYSIDRLKVDRRSGKAIN